jgi:hypothetical protein
MRELLCSASKRTPLHGGRHLFTYALATEKPMVLLVTADSIRIAQG